ncbi:MAG: glutamate--tRNA ligase family protein [Patescibacteria group bacterium]
MTKVVTRFPPSPTGLFHMGGVRTALFNYIFAKQNKGEFLFRLEDTDKERSKKEFEEELYSGLVWLGLPPDNTDVPRQSERTEIYKEHLHRLIAEGKAYEAEDSTTGKGKVVRFKNPNGAITFTDLIRGEISVDTTDLEDFIIARNTDEPVYHMTVVVDDMLSGVTHVIRGEDHTSNTPRQILILEALGGTRPIYAHLPLVLADDKSKLSKRKHGEVVSLAYYRKKGYLPEAIINFVALLGWNPGGDREMLSLDDLIQEFSFEKVQKGGAVFNVQKLNWINKEYIKKMGAEKQKRGLLEFLPKDIDEKMLDTVLPLIIDRIHTWGDVTELWESGEFSYLLEEPVVDPGKLVWKEETREAAREHLTKVKEYIEKVSEAEFNTESIKASIWPYAEEKGRGSVLWPFRMALTGKDKSPDPFTVAGMLGKERTLKRLRNAISLLA